MSEAIANELRKRGLKVTPQRLAIMRIVQKQGHYNGEQIYEELKKTEPSISLSTVYNTLEALREAGLVNSFEINGMKWYEARVEPHANVYCVDKNEIIDMEVDASSIINGMRNKGAEVKNLNIVVYAECSKLKEQK
ncbi:Fur family transcriptional regulator [Sulfuracidifex metallicus]|uniref:Fur family transcriptional regulator n=1 Tax=Sulfuracidifex metallicus TaxID=47303 RepID=UPI0022765622|nr:Fur family transcriptional regulator [Sulfuracidifex metallicus]MCY0849494.1 Fur family transcriptional regulator [Sulfuracidifex metallicus]